MRNSLAIRGKELISVTLTLVPFYSVHPSWILGTNLIEHFPNAFETKHITQSNWTYMPLRHPKRMTLHCLFFNVIENVRQDLFSILEFYISCLALSTSSAKMPPVGESKIFLASPNHVQRFCPSSHFFLNFGRHHT